MTLIGNLHYAAQAKESAVPVLVTNMPDSSASWVENLSAVSGIVSLVVSAIAAVIAYRALRWSKDSWKKDGPQLEAELRLVQKMIPRSGSVRVDDELEKVLPPGIDPIPFEILLELEVVISNNGRTPAQVHNMRIMFRDDESGNETPWYVGLHLDVPAGGSATKKFDAEKLSRFLYLAQIEKVSAVYGVIDESLDEEDSGLRAEMSRSAVELLDSSIPARP